MCRVAVQVFAYAGPLQRIRLACLAPLGSHIQSDSSNTLFLHPLMTGENYYVSIWQAFKEWPRIHGCSTGILRNLESILGDSPRKAALMRADLLAIIII